MRFRIAVSAGLAAVIVLSVFTMIKFDSRVAAEETEIDELISTGVVTTVTEFPVQQDLITRSDNSQQDQPNNFVMSEPVEPGNGTITQVVAPELEPIYVYPDGSIAPGPSDLLSTSSGEFDGWDDDYEGDHDDDHDDWDDDHDEERDHDDDDGRYFSVEKLAGGLFSERDRDDEGHDRDHDDDNDDDDHDRDHDDD